MMKKLTNKTYWDNIYCQKKYMMASSKDEIIKLIDNFIPDAVAKETCFEIGCCPCCYLSYIGKKKRYIINGIDYSSSLNLRMLKWLESLKLSIGSIKQDNFFTFVKENNMQYDFVYSLGFIEHFKNYKEVIKLHDKLVKTEGYLCITVPNYRGKLIFLMHRFFNYSNLKIHYLPSMQPDVWRKMLEQLGYEVLFSGYFGGFQYRHYKEDLTGYKNLIWMVIRPVLDYFSRHCKSDGEGYSKYCGIIAKKVNIK